eukprot:TRINITY_DN16362_c0_g1_i1.p1 TRINITY_DN16362_c0_g1~~TRINITY_DN16362_c0_g1_i1.p1  ORF type:complete len:501 (+),score=199.61 TRINITY_DN16362_c0_g1_i1:57-1559(+)
MRAASALLLLGLAAAPGSASVTVSIDGTSALRKIDDRFVGFTMDANDVKWDYDKYFKGRFYQNATIKALAKHVAPAHFRYGGTFQDFTNYDFGAAAAAPPAGPVIPPAQGTVTAEVLTDKKAFLDEVGWDWTYGLNAITQRTPDNQWDPTQFLTLLKFTQAHNISMRGWELMNEPDLKCYDTSGAYCDCHNKSVTVQGPFVTPEQLAADFKALRGVLDSHGAADAPLFGIDISFNFDYFRTFLQAAKGAGVAVDLTWHHYYAGPETTYAEFLSPGFLDNLLYGVATMEGLKEAHQAGTLWLGETSSLYGGGSENATSSFAAGFLWLDKLGLTAVYGHDAVLRQTFAYGEYSLIGADGRPNADYWTTVLFKRFVGTRVLSVEGGTAPGRAFRTYAFCGKNASTVAVAVLNTAASANYATFAVAGAAAPAAAMDVYAMTSTPGVLNSRDAYLNGVLLRLEDEVAGVLPALAGKRVGKNAYEWPAQSYGFAVLHFDTAVSGCA